MAEVDAPGWPGGDIVQADLDGDGRADFEVLLRNDPGKLAAGDFIL